MTHPSIFKIHPAIGIARLGDSTTDFCLTPETPRGLPTQCDNTSGNALLDAKGQHELPIDTFKDSQKRIKRQAARFRVYGYAGDKDTRGHELKIGEIVEAYQQPTGGATGEAFTGKLVDIEWTVYLANKKASWYAFDGLKGEHGYDPDHPLRNAAITDPDLRQQLIIDPGPQTVRYSPTPAPPPSLPRRAEFALGQNSEYPQSFPPPLVPNSIQTLGELIATQQNGHNRLLVLGGYGNSGSVNTGFGEPHIGNFANNDGWFDDAADGPVTANLILQPIKDDGSALPPGTPTISVAVDDPAWVLTASPGYVPEIENIVTLDDVVYDVAVQNMDYNPEIYGPVPGEALPPASKPGAAALAKLKDWNKNYYPYFYRDIWPILRRPDAYQWVMVFDPADGGDPHNTVPGGRGNLDLDVISIPSYQGQDPATQAFNTNQRHYIYDILRKAGQENQFRASIKNEYNYQPPLMPLLCGDNPVTNELPSKFLRLTDTQLFLLQQWADGKFINEELEGIQPQMPASGSDLDRGVLWNALGGAFYPGGEVCWIIRNPAIYAKPYRIKHAKYTHPADQPEDVTPGALSQPAVVSGADRSSDLSQGLEPGDLTKYSPLPWQADFNECSTQNIDVTYQGWVVTYLSDPNSTGDPTPTQMQTDVFWWPAHRPMQVNLPTTDSNGDVGPQVAWSRNIPQTHAGDLQMVTAWTTLGFVRYVGTNDDAKKRQYAETERNDGSDDLPTPVPPAPQKEHKKP